MSAGALLLLTASCFFATKSLENISNNGWRPMSNEKLAKLQNFIKYPRNIPAVYTSIRPDRYQYQRRAMQIHPKETKQYIRENDDASQYWINDLDEQNQLFHNGDDNEHQSVSNNKQVIRKAKKVDDNTPINTNSFNDNTDEEKSEISSNKVYKVTEVSEDSDTPNQENESQLGYVYVKPKVDTKRREEKNLTKNLFSILANYNIRTSDNLPNYAISLRQNSRNSDHDYVYMQVPVRIPLSYNSLNHQPIDSLLAVFLSNYGLYLPGFYGFQRNYNNLYGYLASNNIHNNKPFGSYKIFSDTDTYH